MTTLTLLASLLLTQYAPSRQGLAPLSPAEEDRVMALGKQLRCPVCQGLSIADSGSSMARAQMDKVRELVREGKSDQDIYDFFTARYGEWVLLKPTTGGLNILLWVAPALLLVLGLAFIVSMRKPHAPSAPSTAGSTVNTSDDAYLERVRKDLES